MDLARESIRENTHERQRQQCDQSERGLGFEKKNDDRYHHCQVRQGDGDHHDECLNLLQVRRRSTHQLTGLRHVVKSHMESHDVVEDPLTQSRFDPPTLSECQPASPSGEDSRHDSRCHHEARPERERATPFDSAIDTEFRQLGD